MAMHRHGNLLGTVVSILIKFPAAIGGVLFHLTTAAAKIYPTKTFYTVLLFRVVRYTRARHP